nr:hypothetical protein [uncultured Flavobacterium sp.]
MNHNNSNYFIQTLAIMVTSIIAFVLLKPFLPKKLFPEVKTASKNIVVDSLMLEALANQDNDLDTLLTTSPKVTTIPQYQFTENDYVGYHNLVTFFEKLNQLESTGTGKVRIAYFGDSMTDGDMIVQDVRTNFQDRFGGEGIGFVNITSESSASRSSVKHEHSKNWTSKSFVNTKVTQAPFGISGNVFFANDTNATEWVKFESSKYKHLNDLPNPTLYYGKSKNQKGKVALISGKDTLFKKLSSSRLINKLQITNSYKKLKMNFVDADSIPFYGVSFENENGVYVDNFSNRGNSGLPLINLKENVLNQFNQHLNYDLIVLQYGTNVLNYGSLNFSWYEKKMKRVIEHLKQTMPNTAIVVISIADKSTKYDTTMQTDSAVAPLVYSQLKYAKEAEVGFVNLFELMGGAGTMIKWTEEEPAKSNKDYTHLNFRGAKIVSDLIFKKIISGYNQFKSQKKTIKKEPNTNKILDTLPKPKPKQQPINLTNNAN